MVAVINKNCFETDSSLRDISRMIGDASYYNDVLTVKVEDGDVFDCPVFGSLPKDDQDILRMIYEQEVQGATFEMGERIEIDAAGADVKDKKVFSPAEGVQYMEKPMEIVVENGLNDGYFVRAVIRHFADERMQHALETHRLKIDNAGGCSNVGNLLEAKCQEWGGSIKFLHCYVILDSDKCWHNHRVPGRSSVKTAILRKGVKLHILEKRALENYMPDSAVASLAGTALSDWNDAYQRLKPEQKDYYCMAEGFLKDIRQYKIDAGPAGTLQSSLLCYRSMSMPEVQQLYDSVSDSDWEALAHGLKITHFKDSYPQQFGNAVMVTRQTLEERTAPTDGATNELQVIADEINALL